MTEKDITLCESAAGVGGNGNLVDVGGGSVGVVSKTCAINIKADVAAHNNNNNNSSKNCCQKNTNHDSSEEGFLSTSSDSANGDQTASTELKEQQHHHHQRHKQAAMTMTTTTTTTTAATTAPPAAITATATTTKASQILNLEHESNSNNTHKVVNSVNLFHCACPTHCVTLKKILDSFKTALSEEQAWALIYQFMALYRKIIDTQAPYICSDMQLPESIEQFKMHRDGSVHFSSSDDKQCKEQPAVNGDDRDAAQQQSSTNDASNNVIGRAFDNHHVPYALHRKIICKVAVIVYSALDYNLQADEQCQMSQELEELFTFMTADEADDDCIDEGIDEGDKRWDDENDDEMRYNETKELDYVLEACKNHIKPTVPEEHYKAVCRALVTEANELGIFLQQVLNNGAEKLHLQTDSQKLKPELAKLSFHEWARFWVQVIDELRRGVRLKKSNYEMRAPIEYQLTPYEILMEDIRSKKYQLRKVMVNGDIPPRVKKDAHAVILEFIRSRPPLKKASERQLPPPIKRTPSPREQLMDSIRKGQTLKHITPPRLKDRLLPTAMTSSASAAMPSTSSAAAAMAAGSALTAPRSKQRLIKVDFSLLQDDDNFFEESSKSHGHAHNTAASIKGVCSQPKMPPYPIGGYMVATTTAAAATSSTMTKEGSTQAAVSIARNTTRRTKETYTQDDYHRFFDNALESYDLATQCESRRASLRRHTIVGCQSNFDESHSTSMPTSRPSSRQSQASDVAPMSETTATTTTTKELHNSYNQEQQQRLKRTKSIAPAGQHQQQQQQQQRLREGGVESACSRSSSSLGPWNKSFLDKKTWMERGDDRLSLTLEEIVHIRSVMTKAELEGLPVGVRVKEDVEKRKVCFLCLRTRFSIFGPWGIQCKLCQRTVCSKCYTKMRIPSEHFRNVPLVLISPSLLSSPATSSTPSPSHQAHYAPQTSASTGNIMDDTFPKSLIERLLRSESERKTRNTVGSAPSSPKHQRSNMSTPGNPATAGNHAAAVAAAAAAAATGQAIEALHDADNNAMSSSYTASGGASAVVKPSPQLAAAKHSYNLMSRSMEGPRSLPVHSPARPLSSSSTLERKSRFSRGFTLSASGSQLAQDQKENMRGEQVPVCNDCQGLVNEITSSAKQKRSSARNRTLQTLTLDLSPVWK